MDEAEQLCDRLVVMDKAKIVAEGSPRAAHRAVLDARGAGAALAARRSTSTLDGKLDGLAERVERLPDRLLSTPTTATRPPSRSTSAACVRRASSSGVARSRTCSSGSPAGRSSSRRRTVRATLGSSSTSCSSTAARGAARIFTTFLAPVLFLAAMGVGLGTFVDQSNPAALGGVSYLVFLAPGLLASQAMQTATGESMYPVLSALLWQRTYLGDDHDADPDLEHRHRPAAVARVPPVRRRRRAS